MRTRLVSALSVVGVVTALVAVPAASAYADVAGQDFESFSTGLVDGQQGWTVTNHSFDYAIADTTGLFGGALGSRALRVSNAVTSGSFGDQLFSQQLTDEAGETTAENGGLSGGVRQSRYTASFTFASASPDAEQPGLVMGVSPDRGDGARMSLVRLYDTPEGLKVTVWGYPGGDAGGFVETTVASGLDRSVTHRLSLTMDLVDGPSNDRVGVSVDGAPPVQVSSWEQYFREVEGNPSRTVDSLLFRASIAAPDPSQVLGKGFYIDSVVQSSGPSPVVTQRTISASDLAASTGGWQALAEPGWTNDASSRLVDGPAGSTGAGSLAVSLGPVVGANNGKYYVGRSLLGVPLADITGFSYRVLTATTNHQVAQPYVNLTVQGGGASYANLVYDPNDPSSNPNALPGSNGVWRTFDAFAPGARWRNTRTLAGEPAWTWHTLAEWLALAPDLTTHPTVGGMYVVSGASGVDPAWTDYVAYLDRYDLTVAGQETVDSFDVGSPLSPATLQASGITTSSATLQWVPAAGTAYAPVDSYELTVDGTPQTLPASATSLDLTGLTPGSQHRASIRAVRSGATGPWATTVFTTNDLDRRTPGAPTLTVGTPDPQGGLPVSWTANAGDSPDFPVQHWIVTLDGVDQAYLGAATKSYTVASVPSGRHTVSVRGVNALGGDAFAAQVVVIAAAEPPATVPPALRLDRTSLTVTYGSPATLTGRAVTGTAPLAGATVTIERATGTTWVGVASATTAADGTFTAAVSPTASSRYRLGVAGATPVVVTVSVRPRLTTKVVYTKVRTGTKVSVAASATPSLPGAVVRLQRLTGSTWKTVASARLGATSTALLTAGTFTTVSARYRVVVPATSTTAQAVSGSLLVRLPRR